MHEGREIWGGDERGRKGSCEDKEREEKERGERKERDKTRDIQRKKNEEVKRQRERKVRKERTSNQNATECNEQYIYKKQAYSLQPK